MNLEDIHKHELTSDQILLFKEHQRTLDALKNVMNTEDGKKFLKYLFKTLQVSHLPEKGVSGEFLHETLGFLRAGRSVFEMCNQADFTKTSEFLTEIERENYELTKYDQK